MMSLRHRQMGKLLSKFDQVNGSRTTDVYRKKGGDAADAQSNKFKIDNLLYEEDVSPVIRYAGGPKGVAGIAYESS